MADDPASVAANRPEGAQSVRNAQRRELPRRFFKEATVAPAQGGFAVLLDGRPIRTPGKALVAVPAEALAARLAAEWAAQGERIDPATMPLTRLVNTTVEAGTDATPGLRDEIVKFAGADLVLYRVDGPADLVARQEAFWDEALAVFSARFDVVFAATVGVVYKAQPPETLERMEAIVSTLGHFSLMALTSATAITGSAVLALGAAHRLFDRDFAWVAAHVDEDFNVARWGEDAEAAARRNARRVDFDSAMTVVEMVGLDG